MKLRNKQTRKVYTVRKDIFVSIIDTGKIEVRVMTPDGHVSFFYRSFDEMLNDWEDYKPAEPLTKDEKIKKLLGEVVELELTVNELNKRFDEFNKHYVELCEEEEKDGD